MPVKPDHNKQAWVKVAAPPKKKPQPKYVSRADQKEALCARLRYFACQPLDGRDRIRMLNRPANIEGGMVDVDRAPSPVPDLWTGAGLRFENGARGSGGMSKERLKRFRDRGFHMESDDEDDETRTMISERAAAPRARARSRARSMIEDGLVEVVDDPSLYEEDVRSVQSYRRTRPNRTFDRESQPAPSLYDVRSQRSASPPPPKALSIRSTRQRDSQPGMTNHSASRPQARHVTAPVSSRPTPTKATPLSSTYQFQSAIFQSKNSTNHYKNVYGGRNKDGSVGPASWASATSALSFD